jgi:acetyltransferase-like isoleucine patch superfamily enzyme
MLGRIIGTFVYITLSLRSLSWRIILKVNGGGMGKKVRIYEGVKLASKRGCPIHLGDHVSLEKGVVLSTSEKGKIKIGNDVYVGEYSILTSNEEIEIGDHVLISPHNDVVDFNHLYENPDVPIGQQGIRAKKITIQDDAWIGSGCKILMGVTIGKGAVIGAGSIVTKDVPSYHVVVGNPAQTIKVRGKEEQKNGSR